MDDGLPTPPDYSFQVPSCTGGDVVNHSAKDVTRIVRYRAELARIYNIYKLSFISQENKRRLEARQSKLADIAKQTTNPERSVLFFLYVFFFYLLFD